MHVYNGDKYRLEKTISDCGVPCFTCAHYNDTTKKTKSYDYIYLPIHNNPLLSTELLNLKKIPDEDAYQLYNIHDVLHDKTYKC